MLRSRAALPLVLVAALAALSGAAQTEDGDVIVLKNEKGMQVHLLEVGASIQRILVPDAAGELSDVILGWSDVQIYSSERIPIPPAAAAAAPCGAARC